MKRRTSFAIAGGCGAIAVGLALAAALRTWPRPVERVHRPAVRIAEPESAYTEEMRCLLLCGPTSARRNEWQAGGPTWQVAAPDGLRVASTASACPPALRSILGEELYGDRCFVHTIRVARVGEDHSTPVMTVKDAEPGSGSGHRYQWSEDSQALFIHGRARLGEAEEAVDLCMVYVPAADRLARWEECPRSLSKTVTMDGVYACRRASRCDGGVAGISHDAATPAARIERTSASR